MFTQDLTSDLQFKVKMQYVHLQSIVDTCILCKISLQSTSILKRCIYTFDMVDTVFSYERELIFCSFLQDFSKGKGRHLQLICNARTAFLLCGAEIVTSCNCNCLKIYNHSWVNHTQCDTVGAIQSHFS